MINGFRRASTPYARCGMPTSASRSSSTGLVLGVGARASTFGVTPAVVTELTRLCGGDYLQVGSFSGAVYDFADDVRAQIVACHRQIGAARKSIAVIEAAASSPRTMQYVSSKLRARAGGRDGAVRLRRLHGWRQKNELEDRVEDRDRTEDDQGRDRVDERDQCRDRIRRRSGRVTARDSADLAPLSVLGLRTWRDP